MPDETGERPSVRVPSKHIIPADAIVINKELGVGEFGVVQQGVWTNEEGERVSKGTDENKIREKTSCIFLQLGWYSQMSRQLFLKAGKEMNRVPICDFLCL